MKKFFAILLAMLLVLSMGVSALADEGETEAPSYTDKLDVAPVVNKTYKVNHGTAPTETFTFSFEGQSYKNGDNEVVDGETIPAIGNVTIAFDASTSDLSKSVTASINANDYKLGVYTYKVTEVAPETKTTGVTYSSENLYLVLTILRDEESSKHYVAAMHYENMAGDKAKGFTNSYDSGSLTVSKKIAGNMADMNKKFKFTISFIAPTGTTIKSTISSDAESGSWDDSGLVYTIYLGHDESVKLDNIPAGTTYTVTEDSENYTSNGVFSDEQKTISANDDDTVVFTNTLTSEIDTGITTDTLPYAVLLGLVVLAGAALLLKRRMGHND